MKKLNGINTENMKNSELAKFKKHYGSLNEQEQQELLNSLKERAVNSLIGTNGSVTGIISHLCSCFEDGKIIYCFNLEDSKKLFIYYSTSKTDEEIFKVGNIISANVYKKENAYYVESINLKAKFKN